MTLTLTLSPETERQLQAVAAARGQDVPTFVQQAIEEKLRTVQLPTFDEICAPLRREVEASGISDEELDVLFRQAREEVWQEKQAKQGRKS